MWPLAVMIEPEPVLAVVGPVGTITRTEALSARTKFGSRPPAGLGCSGGAVGLTGAGVGCAGGAVGLASTACPDGGAVGLAGGSVGFAAAVGIGVAVVAAETGREVGVGVA